jgi:hypothetical protein
VLERAVARVRARTHAYLHRRLTETLTAEQRERLDRLVTVPANERQSPLDRLRDGPYVQSGPEISRAITRLTEIRAIADGLPELDRVPPGKAAALARFASAARAQAVSRLPDDRRVSTLVAFIRTLEASAGDDVIDLFDAVSTTMFAHAQAVSREARMRSLRDLDAAALKLRDASAVLLDDSTVDADVRAAVFALIDPKALAAAIERIGALAQPVDDTYFTELRQHQRRIGYLPGRLIANRSSSFRLDVIMRFEVVAAGARSSSRSERAAASWVFAERVFLCFLRNERDAPLHLHNRNDPAHVPAGTSRRTLTWAQNG